MVVEEEKDLMVRSSNRKSDQRKERKIKKNVNIY